jgi:hypothetical protein
MNLKLLAFILFITLLLIIIQCSTPIESKNNAPVISSLSATPDTVESKETSTITCVANDPDGDDLTFDWSADAGSIQGSGSSVRWLAPDFTGQFSVTCAVDDGNGSSDTRSITITVVETFIPLISEWHSATALPFGRAAHSSVAHNGYIYVIGGTDGSTQYDLDDVLYTSINTDGSLYNWQSTTNLPVGRSNHTSFIHEDRLYVIGGWDATVRFADIDFTGQLGVWDSTVALPEARLAHATVIYNNFVYVLGGYTNSAETGLNDVLYTEINPNGTLEDWQMTTSFTGARFDHCAVVHDGIIYLSGGENKSTIFDDVQYAQLNPDGTISQWNTTTSLPESRAAHTSFVFGDKLYIAGGNSADIIYADIDQSGITSTWNPTYTSFQNRRGNHTNTIYQNIIYIIAGRDDQILFNDVQYARLTVFDNK